MITSRSASVRPRIWSPAGSRYGALAERVEPEGPPVPRVVSVNGEGVRFLTLCDGARPRARPSTRVLRGEGSGVRRRHLSSSTRAALAHTRLVEVVPAGPSRLHSSAPPSVDEPPVVLHPLWAPAHPRRPDGSDARTPLRRTHGFHPGVAPRRGPRPGRRPRPVVPFDIPVEAFAVEVGGGAHPAVRSLGDRRHVYVEHRQNLRRAYRRRQLCLALGLSGAFVVVAAVGLVPRGRRRPHRGATPPRPRRGPPHPSPPRPWPYARSRPGSTPAGRGAHRTSVNPIRSGRRRAATWPPIR